MQDKTERDRIYSHTYYFMDILMGGEREGNGPAAYNIDSVYIIQNALSYRRSIHFQCIDKCCQNCHAKHMRGYRLCPNSMSD